MLSLSSASIAPGGLGRRATRAEPGGRRILAAPLARCSGLLDRLRGGDRIAAQSEGGGLVWRQQATFPRLPFLRRLFEPHFTGVLGNYYSPVWADLGRRRLVAGGVFTIIRNSTDETRLPDTGANNQPGAHLQWVCCSCSSSTCSRVELARQDNPPARGFWRGPPSVTGSSSQGRLYSPTGARAGSASLVVERPYQWGDVFRTYRVVIDDVRWADCVPMRQFLWDLAPRGTPCRFASTRPGSPVHEVLIQAGQETRCHVHYPPGGPRMIPEGWLA